MHLQRSKCTSWQHLSVVFSTRMHFGVGVDSPCSKTSAKFFSHKNICVIFWKYLRGPPGPKSMAPLHKMVTIAWPLLLYGACLSLWHSSMVCEFFCDVFRGDDLLLLLSVNETNVRQLPTRWRHGSTLRQYAFTYTGQQFHSTDLHMLYVIQGVCRSWKVMDSCGI